MRVIRNLFSFISAVQLVVGIAVFAASFLNEEIEFLRIAGILQVFYSILFAVLFTLKQPKGYKAMAFRYYYANGFIYFLYLLIITIPAAIAIKNALPETFAAWKYGNLSGVARIAERKIAGELYAYLSLAEFINES